MLRYLSKTCNLLTHYFYLITSIRLFVKGTFDNNYLHKQYLQMWFGLDAVVVDDVAGVLQPQPQRLPAAVIFVELVELDYQHPLRPQRMEGLRHLYMLPPKIVWCLFMNWLRSFHIILVYIFKTDQLFGNYLLSCKCSYSGWCVRSMN